MLQSNEERQALYNLSRYPEFWTLKKVLQDWRDETNAVSDIDLTSDVAAQVAGKQATIRAIDELLTTLNILQPPKQPTIDTHE